MAKKAKNESVDPPEWESLDDELDWDDVGGRLLANIARGMYSHQGVLREYVQNAADSYKDLAIPSEEHKIIITAAKNSLSIQDFGVGMDDKGIREAKKIAVSTKSDFDDRVGFRGIGIWAGLPACEKLVVDSTTAGHLWRYRLVFDFEDIMKHLDDNINIKTLVDPRYKIERHAARKEEHYTRVTLEGITDGYKKLLDVDELKRIASQVLPSAIDPGFQHHAVLKKMLETWPGYYECHILLQTSAGPEEAFRKFPEDDAEPPTEKILVTDEGVELARAWFCRTKKASFRKVTKPAERGFQLRVKNFAVGDPNMFCAEQGYSYNIHEHQELKTASRLKWFCGEIQVTNNDIKPNTPRDDLEQEQAARLFIEKLREFYKERIVEAGAYSDFNPFREALEEAERITGEGTKSLKKPVDAGQVQRLIDKLTEASNKTKGESGDEIKNLFKQLLRQQGFKDRCAKALTALRKLVPSASAGGGSKGNADNTSADKPADGKEGNQPSTGDGQEKKTKETKKPPNNGATSPANGGPQVAAEGLISEIFEVLERWLGDEYEDLPQIQEEIQQVVDTWMTSHAS